MDELHLPAGIGGRSYVGHGFSGHGLGTPLDVTIQENDFEF